MSAGVDINEGLIMAQLRLMASIFSPLFSCDGGSIKATLAELGDGIWAQLNIDCSFLDGLITDRGV